MWFKVVLLVLLVLGISGLFRGLKALYWMGHFSFQDEGNYYIRYKDAVSYITDNLTLIFGVVLFYWLLG